MIIGFAGKKRAGKDSSFMSIEKIYKPTLRVAFADALKEEVYKYVLKPNNIPIEALSDERKKHFRLIMQGWGTEFRRGFIDDNYWLNKVKEKLDSLDLDGSLIVGITDVRFKNEADFIKSMGGFVVRIHRPDTDDYTDMHSSEIDMDDYEHYDFEIYNDGTLEDLDKKVAFALEQLQLRD